MEEYQLWLRPGESGGAWWGNASTLLIVAVDGPGVRVGQPWPSSGVPCRVLGAMAAGDRPEAVPAVPEDHQMQAARMLNRLGVPSNLLGYAYLRSALTLLLGMSAAGVGLSRMVYPQVAEEYHVTPRSVERAMRHAIAQMWQRGGDEGYRRTLGRLGSIAGDRPTNSEFLAQVTECIQMGL